MKKQTVLVPLDGSDFSREILPVLSRFLHPPETVLLLLRITAPTEGVMRVPDPLSPEVPIGVHTHATHWEEVPSFRPVARPGMSTLDPIADALRLVGEPLAAQGFTVAVAARFGEPAGEVLAVAQETHADLIAMATHGRSGLSRLVLGSVAERVLRQSLVPLLLVRPTPSPA